MYMYHLIVLRLLFNTDFFHDRFDDGAAADDDDDDDDDDEYYYYY